MSYSWKLFFGRRFFGGCFHGFQFFPTRVQTGHVFAGGRQIGVELICFGRVGAMEIGGGEKVFNAGNFIFDATDLAAVAAALIFTVAVLRSRALRPLTPQLMDLGEDDEDFGEEA